MAGTPPSSPAPPSTPAGGSTSAPPPPPSVVPFRAAPSGLPALADADTGEIVAPDERDEQDERTEQDERALDDETYERVDLSDLLSELAGGIDAPDVEAALTDPRDVQRPERASAAVIESTGGIDFEPVFATFGSRVLGLVVDLMATLVMMAPGAALIVVGRLSLVGVLGGLLVIAGFALATRRYARSIATTGQWFGNRVASTRVVDVTNGELITVPKAATRFLLRALISPVLLFGFFVAFADPQRRAFHDHAAESIVTRPPRETWAVGDD